MADTNPGNDIMINIDMATNSGESINQTIDSNVVNEVSITSIYLVLIILSAIICVIGFLGNITIATVIWRRKYMQTSINWLLFNLAVCDLAIVLITIPGNLIYQVIDWPFGEVGCKYLIMPLMEHFASVGILTHTAIGYARYKIVQNAGNTRTISTKLISCIISCIWLISFLVLSVTLMGILGEFRLYFGKGRWICALDWLSPWKRKAYRLCVFVLTYLLPVIMTGYSYARIHYIARKSLRNVNVLLPDDVLIKRRKKSRRMNSTLIMMYVIFAVTTLPLQLFMLLFDFRVFSYYEGAERTFDLLLILFYTQILSNPLVLLYMGDEFRKEIKYSAICRCFIGFRLRELPNIVRRKMRSIDRQHMSSGAFATSVVWADNTRTRPRSYTEYTTIAIDHEYGKQWEEIYTKNRDILSQKTLNCLTQTDNEDDSRVRSESFSPFMDLSIGGRSPNNNVVGEQYNFDVDAISMSVYEGSPVSTSLGDASPSSIYGALAETPI